MIALPKKIIGLDLLRFIMAVLMVLFHVQGSMTESILNNLGLNGFYGTSVFFILSGFILTHVYYGKIQSNKFSNTKFLIKRFNALYPIHIITLILSLSTFILLSIITNKHFPIELQYQTVPTIHSQGFFELNVVDIKNYIIQSLLLVQAWEYRYLFLNIAAWSVSALFFFYLFFYYFCSWLSQRTKFFTILIIIWIISLIFPTYMIITNNFSSETLGFLHRNPILRLTDFLSGITFYFICKKYPYNENLKYPSLIFAIIGFISIYFFVKYDPYAGYALSHNGLFIFSQLSLVYYFISIKITHANLVKMIERLGKASLTIYMLHLPLLAIFFIAYKLLLSSFISSNFSELLMNAKTIEYMSTTSVLAFLFILIPISLFVQEKFFTPLQLKLNDKILKTNQDRKSVES